MSGKLADVGTAATPRSSLPPASWLGEAPPANWRGEALEGISFLLAGVVGAALLFGTVYVLGAVFNVGDPGCDPPDNECLLED